MRLRMTRTLVHFLLSPSRCPTHHRLLLLLPHRHTAVLELSQLRHHRARFTTARARLLRSVHISSQSILAQISSEVEAIVIIVTPNRNHTRRGDGIIITIIIATIIVLTGPTVVPPKSNSLGLSVSSHQPLINIYQARQRALHVQYYPSK